MTYDNDIKLAVKVWAQGAQRLPWRWQYYYCISLSPPRRAALSEPPGTGVCVSARMSHVPHVHMSAHVCTCRTAAACPSYGCGHAGTDVKSRPRSARRTSGGRHHPPSPFTHCLTSDQTWEPCLTMIGMELNRILEDKGSRLAYLSMKIFRTIIPVSVTCLFL